MKIMFYISIGLTIFCILGVIYAYHIFNAKNWKNTDFANIQIGSLNIRAEVAASPLKKSAGLSARSDLAQNSGMLFIFSRPSRYSFWMRGMRFPLDFIWIKDHVVVDVSKNIPFPKKMEFPDTVLPAEPADMILEINAGLTDIFNIRTGDKVNIEKAQ